jgi:hypothetical protein
MDASLYGSNAEALALERIRLNREAAQYGGGVLAA